MWLGSLLILQKTCISTKGDVVDPAIDSDGPSNPQTSPSLISVPVLYDSARECVRTLDNQKRAGSLRWVLSISYFVRCHLDGSVGQQVLQMRYSIDGPIGSSFLRSAA